jgi:hypothetical protein
LDCFKIICIINNLLKDNNIFSLNHRIVFRTISFLYKIITNNNAPLEFKSLFKAQVNKDNKYNLRSNGRTLVVPSRSKSKYGDLRFKIFFANYVNFFRLFDLNLLVSTFIHSFLSNIIDRLKIEELLKTFEPNLTSSTSNLNLSEVSLI